MDEVASMDEVAFSGACVAASEGEIQHVKRWLMRGVDINHVDSRHRKSLGHYALSGGGYRNDDRSDLIRFLASQGMDVNRRDVYRQSLLHHCEFPEEAAALIELGADVNATDLSGNTPLFHYVECVPHRGLELIRLLLRHGCDPAAEDEHGKDVSMYAREFYDANNDPADGVVEDALSRQLATATFLEDVKAAGGWKAYLRAPRVQLVRLRSLCDRGRAAPPSVGSGKLTTLRNLSAAEIAVFARLFGAPPPRTPRGSSGRLPNEIFWHVLAFWRTDRD